MFSRPLAALCSVVVLALVGCSSTAESPTLFFDALASCNLWDAPIMKVGDGGRTLTLDGLGKKDDAGLTYDDETCILDSLKAPDSVKSHIEQTTALDGRQTESWANIAMSWSYHPDRGLDAVLSITQ